MLSSTRPKSGAEAMADSTEASASVRMDTMDGGVAAEVVAAEDGLDASGGAPGGIHTPGGGVDASKENHRRARRIRSKRSAQDIILDRCKAHLLLSSPFWPGPSAFAPFPS